MLVGLVLMVSALVIMYRCVQRKSRQQKIESKLDSLYSTNDRLDLQVGRLESLLGKLTADTERYSTLQYRAGELQDTVESLEYRRDELERDNLSMTRINGELKRSNTELVEKASHLRDTMAHDEQNIRELEQRIALLKKIREGLEIAVNNIPAEEVHYLSQPIFSMGLPPSAQNHLANHGIQYVGDLVRLDEQYLMEIWGVGPATVERITTKLSENGVCFGMDVIRIDNHWYRRITA